MRLAGGPETWPYPNVPVLSGRGAEATFGRGAGDGPGEDARRSIGRNSALNSCCWEMKLCGRERHIDVFEGSFSDDRSDTGRGLDEVIAGLAGLFAAESVGKNEWFSKLTSAHQKTGAIDGPLAFRIHNASFTLPG